MPKETEYQPDNRALERHVQSLLLTLIAAGILWIASSATSTQIHLAHIDEQLAVTQAAIKEMYRAEDAKRDNADVVAQVTDLRKRVDSLERVMNTRGGK